MKRLILLASLASMALILGLATAAFADVSCTHSKNVHYHSGDKYTTYFHSSHRHGSEHHHHGRINIDKQGGGIVSYLYDRQCPKH